MVIWIIGLAGAGKTTIGHQVYQRLRVTKPNIVFLDGDHVRSIMGNDLGYTIEDRRTNAWRICHLCQYLDQQGIDVVCAILSLFHETQEWNRRYFSQYFEVYIEVSMKVLQVRDQKGLYSKALVGQIENVVGIDIPFNPPLRPNLVIDNGQPDVSAEHHVAQIVAAVKEKM